MDTVHCPFCGHSYFMTHYSTTTAVYYPPIYKDGVNQNPDGNVTTTYCTCMNCHHKFHVEIQYGRVQKCVDDGLEMEVPIVSTSITVEDGSCEVDDAKFVAKSNFSNGAIEIATGTTIEKIEAEVQDLRREMESIKKYLTQSQKYDIKKETKK